MIRNALQRFMYGRYGNDQLNTFLLFSYLVLYLLHAITRVGLFYWVSFAGIVWALFRMLSRNFTRRRAENGKFLKRIIFILQLEVRIDYYSRYHRELISGILYLYDGQFLHLLSHQLLLMQHHLRG